VNNHLSKEYVITRYVCDSRINFSGYEGKNLLIKNIALDINRILVVLYYTITIIIEITVYIKTINLIISTRERGYFI
jgi:hypothetical protein